MRHNEMDSLSGGWMSKAHGLIARFREALACEECRRWRRASLQAAAALALIWVIGRFAGWE